MAWTVYDLEDKERRKHPLTGCQKGVPSIVTPQLLGKCCMTQNSETGSTPVARPQNLHNGVLKDKELWLKLDDGFTGLNPR